jgi:hypothetical protein
MIEKTKQKPYIRWMVGIFMRLIWFVFGYYFILKINLKKKQNRMLISYRPKQIYILLFSLAFIVYNNYNYKKNEWIKKWEIYV